MCHAAVFFHLRPLDGNSHLSQMHSWAPLQVLHGDADVLFPVSGVGSYSPAGGCSWFLPRCIHALWQECLGSLCRQDRARRHRAQGRRLEGTEGLASLFADPECLSCSHLSEGWAKAADHHEGAPKPVCFLY